MEKILISSCLIGDKTRYDGRSNYAKFVEELKLRFDLVPFCPEVEGGLPIPRPRSEIKKDTVISEKGRDVTSFFEKGAEKAVMICSYLGIRYAILKEDSPSCGVHSIYDGSFSSKKKEGMGITAKALSMKGIIVMNEVEAEAFLSKLIEEEKRHKEAVAQKLSQSQNQAKEAETKPKEFKIRPYPKKWHGEKDNQSPRKRNNYKTFKKSR